MSQPRIGFVWRLLRPGLVIVLTGACALHFPIERGEELGQQRPWEDAVRAYQAAVQKDPRNTEARLGLARAMMEAADQLVKQGQELERTERPADSGVLYRRALTYNGEHQGALAGLDRIARAAVVKEKLTRARDRMAQGEWRAALRVDPESGQAKALKQELAVKLAAETVPSKLDTDPERLAQQLFATKPLLSLQDQLARSEGTVTSNVVRLYKALGGGWTSLGVGEVGS